jgi:hypothetical protein
MCFATCDGSLSPFQVTHERTDPSPRCPLRHLKVALPGDSTRMNPWHFVCVLRPRLTLCEATRGTDRARVSRTSLGGPQTWASRR